jgi:short-subunit dehydrogenase
VIVNKSALGELSKYRGVLMTGGSSGIGYDILVQLKSLNPKLWVGNLSRSKPEGFSFDFCHFPCDFSKDPVKRKDVFLEALSALDQEAGEGPVLIVNNSGFGDYGAFRGEDLDLYLAMMEVNVMSPIVLTGLADALLRRRGGAIINVASTAAFQPTPYMSIYGAGKSFLMNWSLSLSQDYRGTGVHVLVVCPGPTETRFFTNAGFKDSPVKGFGQSSPQVAKVTLEALAARRTLVISGWSNRLLTILVAPLCKSWAAVASRWMLGAVRKKKE